MEAIKLSVTQTDNNTIKSNLRKWAEEAKGNHAIWGGGMLWYKAAQDFTKYLSSTYGIDAYVCACVVAILSPNNKWSRNMVDAEALIVAWKQGGSVAALLVKVCTYNANKTKAVKVLDGQIELSTKSPKTHSFAMNVGLNSPEHITVDKWHLRACVCTPVDGVVDAVESCTATQYRRVEALTSEVAKEYGIKGYEFQAIVWVMIKKTWNR